MARVLALALLAALALAGCGGEPAEGGADGPAGDDGAGSAAAPDGRQEGAASAGGGGNASGSGDPPDLVLTVGSGQDDPLNVTLGLSISDPDGDTVAWRVTVGQGSLVAAGQVEGTGNATASYQAPGPGEYTFHASADDGTHRTAANATITLTDTAGSQSVSASYAAGVEACLAAAYDAAGVVPLAGTSPLDGITRVEFALEPATIGRPWSVAWTFDTGYLSVYVAFTDDGGAVVAGTLDANPNFGDAEQSGVVPEGASYVVLLGCGGPASASVTYQA